MNNNDLNELNLDDHKIMDLLRENPEEFRKFMIRVKETIQELREIRETQAQHRAGLSLI